MNIYPYVYRIDHPSGEFYIGSRTANRVPAEADFGAIYKTSSKICHTHSLVGDFVVL